MSDAPLPSVASLLPHAGPMLLLDRVLEHTADTTACAVDPGRSALLADADGGVPVWVGLEYMAQCVAAHGGLVSRARAESPRPGLLLGSRRVRFSTASFSPERELRVEARHHHGESGLVAFDCEIRDAAGGEPLVRARVNIYIVDRWEDLQREKNDSEGIRGV